MGRSALLETFNRRRERCVEAGGVSLAGFLGRLPGLHTLFGVVERCGFQRIEQRFGDFGGLDQRRDLLGNQVFANVAQQEVFVAVFPEDRRFGNEAVEQVNDVADVIVVRQAPYCWQSRANRERGRL